MIQIRVGEITQGRLYLYIRSPLSEPDCFFFNLFFSLIHVGENTQERRNSMYSRSPLSEPEWLVSFGLLFLMCRGEYTGEGEIVTLVLPSMN